MPHIFIVLRCRECDNPATDPENNPEGLNGVELHDKYNSWAGWLCKCGYYNALDP
jgi:hypothetical protein